MSRISFFTCIAVAAVFCSEAGRVNAQFPGNPVGGVQRPPFSPYLNLNRPGTSPAVNYFGIVRPQFQALSTYQSLEQQASANRQAISNFGAPATGLPTTGHPVAFLNTSGYFLTMNPNQGQSSGGSQGVTFGQSGSSFGGSFRNNPPSTPRR